MYQKAHVDATLQLASVPRIDGPTAYAEGRTDTPTRRSNDSYSRPARPSARSIRPIVAHVAGEAPAAAEKSGPRRLKPPHRAG